MINRLIIETEYSSILFTCSILQYCSTVYRHPVKRHVADEIFSSTVKKKCTGYTMRGWKQKSRRGTVSISVNLLSLVAGVKSSMFTPAVPC